MFKPQHLRHVAALLLCALLMLLSYGAFARTISNVAAAQWGKSGNSFTASSNLVSFEVVEQPTTLETYTNSQSSGQSLVYTPSTCGGATIPVPGGIQGGTAIASIERATSLRIGDYLYFRVASPSANLDPSAIDSLQATLTTESGDRETITVFETAANSGIFLGALPTTAVPPQPVSGDCRLSVSSGDKISIECHVTGKSKPIAIGTMDVLADPFGVVFDSDDGSAVNGARITLVDAVTGAPAEVYADDGVTRWPSTVYSGQTIQDGAGNSYAMGAGEYRFPLVRLGQYRLVIEPPSPYSAPSTATAADLAGLARPDGGTFLIADGSYGRAFALASPAPVRLDIPLDKPQIAVTASKTASRQSVLPGEAVFYTVTVKNVGTSTKRRVVVVDTPASTLRLRPDSIRVDGSPAPTAIVIAPDGRTLTINLGDIAAGATRKVTYAMTVRADAAPGQAVNHVIATDSRNMSATAEATVRIEQDYLTGRMTLIGRIADGGCALDGVQTGIPGVRVVLEDGSFAITDQDGRYHFEGIVPGTHVVQVLSQTLPKGGRFVDCSRSTRSAGSAASRFVIGQGGSLIVADFSAVLPEGANPASQLSFGQTDKTPTSKSPAVAPASSDSDAASDRSAAGAETDWLGMGDGPTDFLFPALDHNPRSPAIRVVIRHRAGQKVELAVDGKPVDPIAFDGSRTGPGGGYAVSIWRGIPLHGETTRLKARVLNAGGSLASELAREVHFTSTPARAELVAERSRLVADGSTRPVLALRMLDRFGRPVHSGLTGEVGISAPYESAEAQDAMQTRALVGLGRAAPRWVVKGDDGIALVELAPTMVSGKLHLDFTFGDDRQRRSQTLDAWIVPGEQPWTLVGLAEGSVGSRTVADNMERSGQFDSDLGEKARVAFYAKGRVLGKFLLTASYDSAKQVADQRLLGAIDPNAYYTVFADGSERRFDAASRKKLYVRVETSTFYALYGDFNTGFDQTQLARYQRTATGAKAEVNVGGLHVQGFAANVASTHRRDEIQGGGISGPYRLSSRAVIANSEVVTIEVRDRFRSEVIVDRKLLTRFIDYDIDLLSGTITFKEPILSRDPALNPRFIVIDYELDTATDTAAMNAGLRADLTVANGKLRVGASVITDKTDDVRTNLLAVDAKARIGENTELRAEAAISTSEGADATAWLIEAEHHDGKLDLLAYARSADSGFGVGQLNGAERGRRKLGLDARYNLTEKFALATSAWHDDSLIDDTSRDALQFGGTWRSNRTDGRLGIAMLRDTLADGTSANSTVLEGGVTQRLFDNKLELDASTSIALDKAESVDLPERHRLAARYSLTSGIRVVGSYEIAKGKNIDARTAQGGIEITPWDGAKVVSALGQQDIAELGKRSYAAFGLAQSLPVTKNLTIDASLDSNRTIGGIDPTDLVNSEQPVTSGGNLGESGTITEDFTAMTLGASWRNGSWSSTLRGEWRDGDSAKRKGVTFGAIRQLGEGSMVGSGFTWTRATATGGATTEILDGAIAAAHRPTSSDFAFLTKLEFRSDIVKDAIAGEAAGAGRTALTVTGDAKSRRLIGSVSANWSPKGEDDGQLVQRTEIGVFAAMRHNFDRYEGFDLSGTALLGGLDARFGIGDHLEIGGAATVRTSLSDHTTSFSVGPQIGISPTKDMLLMVGYNITGYRDRDFSAARSTDKGLYATVRMKFDTDSFRFLGLGR